MSKFRRSDFATRLSDASALKKVPLGSENRRLIVLSMGLSNGLGCSARGVASGSSKSDISMSAVSQARDVSDEGYSGSDTNCLFDTIGGSESDEVAEGDLLGSFSSESEARMRCLVGEVVEYSLDDLERVLFLLAYVAFSCGRT